MTCCCFFACFATMQGTYLQQLQSIEACCNPTASCNKSFAHSLLFAPHCPCRQAAATTPEQNSGSKVAAAVLAAALFASQPQAAWAEAPPAVYFGNGCFCE